MIIRQQQWDSLERASAKSFEDRTYAHLKGYFAPQCELLGEPIIRAAILFGWEKAISYGLTAECCVRSYIESMCILGGKFDTDPLLPWAAEILTDRSSSDQVARGDRLYHKMWDYVDHAAKDYRDAMAQPTTGRFMTDLRELRSGGDEIVAPDAMPMFQHIVEMRLRRLFPAKCAYIGDEKVSQAVADGVEAAGSYGITAVRGATFYTSVRFVLGGEFDRDPMVPWASAALTDPTIPDQFKRADKLYAEGVSFLRRWWAISAEPGGVESVLGE